MPIYEKFPAASSGSNPPWSSLSNAYTADGGLGTWAVDSVIGTNSPAWFKGFGFSIPKDPVGFQIEGRYSYARNADGSGQSLPTVEDGPPLQYHISFALSLDGVTPLGTIYTIDCMTATPPTIVGTGTTDMMGTSLTKDQVNASTFGVIYWARTDIANENITTGTSRAIEYLKVRVYTTPDLVYLGLHGTGDSTGAVQLLWNPYTP